MNTVSSSNSCPRCGAAIPSEAPDGLCPRCVLLGAATPSESGIPNRLGEPPPLETVQAAFPQLKIEGLIGRGGMGFVYRARQPQLDRTVALKLLPVPAGADPTFAERFAREGRLLARLNHPNIVSVFDFGQAAGFAFLLLEFVDGVNLRQAMLAGRFSAREALAIVPKVCDALQFAHEHGVLHRDIKPENILLDAAGRVKIADFGIAKLVGDRAGDVTLTASGARLGTPHYMAPEQVEKPSEVDHRADIYSLGVVFYELLTGELPLGRFAAPSAKADLDSRVDAIVMRALAKERELRQQSAGEVKTEVEGLAGMPALAAGSAGFQAAPVRQPVFEYKSPRSLWGLPLLHLVRGVDPTTGREREARGIVAIGGRAIGVLAIGGLARGVFAFGGAAFGLFAFGGLAVGGVVVGGMALGLFSFGGMALGLILALGGIAVGWSGFGGLVVAQYGLGGSMAVGERLPDTGLAGTLIRWMPWLWIPTLPLSLVPGLVSVWAHRKLDAAATPRPNPWPRRLGWLSLGLGCLCLLAFLIYGFATPLTYLSTLRFEAGATSADQIESDFASRIAAHNPSVSLTRIPLTHLFEIQGSGYSPEAAAGLANDAYASLKAVPWAKDFELQIRAEPSRWVSRPNRPRALVLGLMGFIGLGLPGLWLIARVRRDSTPPPSGATPNPWPHRLLCLLVALVALPASALVASVLAPALSRASGGLGGITAGLMPMTVGALLVWLFWKTRPTAAQAQPREQWNPWPKRLFMAVIALVVVPVSLVFVGLLVPYLLLHAAVLPPLPTPMAAGGPHLTGVVADWPVRLVPTERLASDSQLRLRWNLRSRQPAMVRLSIGANIQEFELQPDRSGAGYSLPVNVLFNPQEDGEALLMEAFAGDAPGGTVLLAHLPGRPAELLIKANELVAGELPLKFNTPVWIAFAGLEQVRLEVLPNATAPAHVTPPSNGPQWLQSTAPALATPPSNTLPQEPPAPGSTPPQ